MFAVFSLIFGFVAPFLPQIIKLFQAKQDHKHEIDMMRLRIDAAAKASLHRLEEINAQADIAEALAIRQPQLSFGVQMLDAAAKSNWSAWTVVPVFYLFSFLDFMSGMVRTTITYAAFAFYVAYKWALLDIVRRGGAEFSTAILNVWTENDFGIVLLVLGYWFGSRAAKSKLAQTVFNP